MEVALRLAREFVRRHPIEAAQSLERLPPAEASAVLAELPAATAAAGLRGMVAPSGAECLAGMARRQAAEILTELPPDVAAGLLLRLGPEEREGLLAESVPKAAAAMRQSLRFRPDTAGALADPRVQSFADGTSASQALSRLRRSTPPSHGYLYVVDRDDRLLGALTLHQLMLAPPKSLLSSLMDPRIARLPATADRTAVLSHEGWRQAHALPVVDDTGRLIGVVGHDTLRRLERQRQEPGALGGAASFGLAFAELWWVGMARVVGGIAQAVLQAPAGALGAEVGGRHER